MTRTKGTIGISAVILVASALLGVACSSSDSTVPGSGGSAGTGGSAGAGVPGTAGASTAGVSGAAGSAGSLAGGAGGAAGAPNDCTPLPANLLLTDFSPATFMGAADGSSWTAGKQTLWGSATSLTGGDVFYQGKAGSAPRATLHGQTLTVTATIEAGDYAGYMFNFAPKCTNASTTQGLKFDVLEGSTLGNATLKVQMQQKSDFPSTANPGTRPGACVPTSMATQYNDCLSPATTVVGSGSPLNPGTVEAPWSNFGGGSPVYALDNGQLMAIQWQFECPPDGGTVTTSGGAGGSSAGAGAGGATAGADTGGVGGTAGSSAGTSGGLGSSGSAGSSGTAGSSGSAGSSGTAGSDAGSSGTAGSSGSAGSSGTAGSDAGSSGTAGSSTAGSGGSASTTPPCVVSFTIDNVTFY